MVDDHETDEDAYQVGYGRPPKQRQFQKGQSGNPSGRPKGAKGFRAATLEVMAEHVRVRGPNGPVEMSNSEAMVRVAIKKALNGDLRAMQLVREWLGPEADSSVASASLPLTPQEQALWVQMLDGSESLESWD